MGGRMAMSVAVPSAPPCGVWHARACLCFAAVVALLLAAACTSTPEPLRLGSNVWPGYEPLFVARALGFYPARTVELVNFPSAAEVMRAYRQGSLDIAATTADEALSVVATQPDQRIVLVCDFSKGADVLLARFEFGSVRELRGRRIGFEPNALGAYMLTRALEVSGLGVRDVIAVPVQLEDHERAFSSGSVDAIVTFEPRRTRLLAAGARQLFDSAQIPGEVVDVLLARRQLVEANNPALRNLIAGWFRALDYLKSQPDDFARRVAARERVSPATFLETLHGLELPDRAANQRLLGRGDGNLQAALRGLSGAMLGANLLSNPVELSQLLDDRFVRTRVP
jgi:NitT/TauT family transport system substrate-binding protein